MHLLARFLWVFAILLSPVAGCNDVIRPTAPVSITIWKGAGAGEDYQLPLEGVELCETDTDNCVMTDANGEATLELPTERETGFTRTKEGYASYLLADVVPATGERYVYAMATDHRIAAEHDRLMAAYPMRGTGTILVGLRLPFPEATFELIGATSKAFYVDDDPEGDILWSQDLTGTTSWGSGGFVEVTPSEYQIKLGGTAQGCTPHRAWPGNDENSIRIPVREGYITHAAVNCPPPP
jgi:hypothetical protein